MRTERERDKRGDSLKISERERESKKGIKVVSVQQSEELSFSKIYTYLTLFFCLVIIDKDFKAESINKNISSLFY